MESLKNGKCVLEKSLNFFVPNRVRTLSLLSLLLFLLLLLWLWLWLWWWLLLSSSKSSQNWYPLFHVPLLLSSPRSHWEPLPGHRLMKKTLEISHLRRRKTLCYPKSPPTRGRGEGFSINFIYLCIFVFLYFFYTNTLYFIFTYKGKVTKIVEN